MLHFDPDEFDDADTFMAYQRLESLGAMLTNEDYEQFDPPASVRAAIVAQIAGPIANQAIGERGLTVVSDEPPAVISLDATRAQRGAAPVASKRRWAVPLSAAAAVVVLAGVIWTATSNDSTSPAVELASAPLTELQGSGAAASAALVRESDGLLHVQLADAKMPPAPDGFFYEIWLVDPGVTNPQSLSTGSMGDRVDFTVPDGVDPAEYPIIDVSLEPDDGNPAHAGVDHSVARGVLEL